MTKAELVGFLTTVFVCSRHDKAVCLLRADLRDYDGDKLVLTAKGYGHACEETLAADLLVLLVE